MNDRNKLKSIIKNNKSFFSLGVVVFISIATFFRWFSFDIFSSSDWRYSYKESLGYFLSFPSWNPLSNFGKASITLWRAPYDFLVSVLGFFGADFSIIEKLLIFWPIVLLLPIGSFLLAKKMTKSNFASIITAIVFTFNTYFLAIITQGHLLLVIAYSIFPIVFIFVINAVERSETRQYILATMGLFIMGLLDFRVFYICFFIVVFYVLYHFFVVEEYKKKMVKKKCYTNNHQLNNNFAY